MRISIMTSTAKNLRQLAIGAIVATAACSADSPSQTTEPRSGSPVARGAIAVSADVSSDAAQNQLLATVRQATAAYHRVDAAIADGYVLGSPCEAMPGQGIGIHYRKGALIDG